MSFFKANVSAATSIDGNVLTDFSRFLEESSIIDTAVGIIIGNSFKTIVDSFVQDVMSPVISSTFGQVGTRLEDMYYVVGDMPVPPYSNLLDAEKRGGYIIRYGRFVQRTLQFLLQALVVFLIIRTWSRIKHGVRF